MTLGRVASILLVLSALITIPAVMILILAGYEILVVPPVIQYTNLPIQVVNDPVPAGETVVLKVERCANDPLAPDPVVYLFTHELINKDTGLRIGLPSGASSMPHGCQTGDDSLYSVLNIVPVNTPPGEYYLLGTSTAYGKFKTSIVQWYSEPFMVVPNNRQESQQPTNGLRVDKSVYLP